jgi:hypothetical protein
MSPLDWLLMFFRFFSLESLLPLTLLLGRQAVGLKKKFWIHSWINDPSLVCLVLIMSTPRFTLHCYWATQSHDFNRMETLRQPKREGKVLVSSIWNSYDNFILDHFAYNCDIYWVRFLWWSTLYSSSWRQRWLHWHSIEKGSVIPVGNGVRRGLGGVSIICLCKIFIQWKDEDRGPWLT